MGYTQTKTLFERASGADHGPMVQSNRGFYPYDGKKVARFHEKKARYHNTLFQRSKKTFIIDNV